jgi:PEP-CTERM motif
MKRLLCSVIGGMTFITGAAWGAAITLTPGLPPDSGEYRTPAQVHAAYATGIGLVELDNVRHHFFLNITHPPCPGCEMDQFDSTVDADLFINGAPQGHIVMTGLVLVQVFGYNVGPPGTPGTPFPTEMLQLNLSGGGPFLVRESPSLPSQGQTRIDDLGNGTFRIDSFFDVFTELSIDGGTNWTPSIGSTRVSLQETPEPGTFVLSGLALAGLGFLTRRRRAGR